MQLITYSTPESRAKRRQDRVTASLWSSWHTRALIHIGPDDNWIQNEIIARLPCGECKGHAIVYLADNPPRWDDYFAWTVDFHNAVNIRIGKPIMSIEEALIKWAPQADIKTPPLDTSELPKS